MKTPTLQPNETLVISHTDGSVVAAVRDMGNIQSAVVENNDDGIVIKSIDWTYWSYTDEWEMVVVWEITGFTHQSKFFYTAKIVRIY